MVSLLITSNLRRLHYNSRSKNNDMIVSLENRAKLACLYAGAVWGLFWIPLRALEDAGLHGLWVLVVYFAVPTLCLLPIGIWRWKHFKAGGLQLQITAMLSGLALLLYTMSIVYTEVVRAILLFYLTPIWGTILGRIFLGDAITLQRIFAMVVAFIGALTIFGLGLQFPVPQNVGDWMGVGAGILWALASLRINIYKDYSATEMTLGFFFWSLIFSIIAALIFVPSYIPSLAQTLPVLAITNYLYSFAHFTRHLCLPLGTKVSKSRRGWIVVYDRTCGWFNFSGTAVCRTLWHSRSNWNFADNMCQSNRTNLSIS